MSTKLPDIAWIWDGQTKTAELQVNGRRMTGEPNQVEYIFHRLNAMANRLRNVEHRLEHALDALNDLQEAIRDDE